MKKNMMICAAGLAFMLPQTASAQDWNGIYVGGQLGYNSYDVDTDVDGLTYGVVAGFGGTSGGLYGAIEAEFNLSNVEGEGSGVEFEENSIGAINLIAGAPIAPNTLLYGKLGFFRSDVEYEIFGVNFDDTGTGYELAFGGEFALQNNLSIRGEVGFFDGEFDDVDVEFDGTSLSLGVISRF
ncbi:porin family protein [Pseudaestuariivita rosea]|uniref:porin family protein n=1 Tax=Pseudaestuariivita rosea TaxID=2763263 RepID=UPI001ABB3688|nr:porin family protein [Pseudaestuariivita rosea]